MNAFIEALERASCFGLVALCVALIAQWALDKRVPAAWRVWVWRAALLQTAGALIPLAPLKLALLPPRSSITTTPRIKKLAPRNALVERRSETKSSPRMASRPRFSAPPFAPAPDFQSQSPLPAFPGDEAVDEVGRATVAPVLPVPPQLPLSESASHFDGRAVLFGLYTLGIAFQLLILAHSLRRLRRHLRLCQPIENAAISSRLSEVARRMSVETLPQLLQSPSGAPFLAGIWRPAIVLPASLLGAPNSDLDAVLCHELAHLQRRDLAWNALMRAVQLVFWFHPLIWVARRLLALETESACDEMVLGSLRIAPATYGALLLNTMNTQKTPLSVGLTDDFGALETRLLRLDRAPLRPRRALSWAFAGTLSLAFGALVPLRLVARAQTRTEFPVAFRTTKTQGAKTSNSPAKPAEIRRAPAKSAIPPAVTSLGRVAELPPQSTLFFDPNRQLRLPLAQPRRFPTASPIQSSTRFSAPAAMAMNVSWGAPMIAAPKVATRGAVSAPPINAMPLAETAMIALARRRGVNVLIDSTDINPLAPPIPGDPRTRGPQDDVVNVMLSLGSEFRLSSEYPDSKTFLFWAEPDQNQIVQAVYRGEGVGADDDQMTPEEVLMALRTQLDPEGVKRERAAEQADLRPFLTREAAQRGTNLAGPLPLEAKLSQLPLELQKQVVSLFLPSSPGLNATQRSYAELWTRDEVWQRARIFVQPAAPPLPPEAQKFIDDQRRKVEAAGKKWVEIQSRGAELVVHVNIEDGKRKLQLSMYPSGSVGAQQLFENSHRVLVVAAPGLLPGKIRVLKEDEAPQNALTLDKVQTTPGSALASLQRNAAPQPDLSGETGLGSVISLEATRRPLGEFIRDAARAANVVLAISPDIAAKSPLISARLQAMPLRELMRHLAYMYGAIWTKDAPNRFTLTSRNLSSLELQLLRVGRMGTYRFRDNNVAANGDRRAEFEKFQNSVIAQAGEAILKEPGIAFTALPLATQQELRRRALSNVQRKVVQSQIESRNLLQGDWSLRLQAQATDAEFSFLNSPWQRATMLLLVDGKVKRNRPIFVSPLFNLARLRARGGEGGNTSFTIEQPAPNAP